MLTPVVHVLSLSSRVGAIADNEDAVVQLVGAVGAGVVDEDAVFVEHELALGDIDGH